MIGKPETGSMGSPEVSIGKVVGGVTSGWAGVVPLGLVPDTNGSPVSGLNGTNVLGLIGNPEVGSIASGSPLLGLMRVPLMVGKPETESIGRFAGSTTGVVTGVVVVKGWPLAGLKGTRVVGLIGKPDAGSIARGLPELGSIRVPLRVGKPLRESIGSVAGLTAVATG